MAVRKPLWRNLLAHMHRHHYGAAVGMNMTPMIDITFLLLTFFMLATHFASADRVDLDLPRPDDNQSINARFREKMIVNLQYQGEDQTAALSVGAFRVPSIADLQGQLDAAVRENPRMKIILRADRRLAYRQVHDVMERIKQSGLTNLEIVTELP